MKNFKPTKERSSLISNEVLEQHRYNLTLNGQKVLFGLAQSIDHTLDIFGEIEIDINNFFDFLDISKREDRWQLVRDAFYNITENPLQFSTLDAKRWSSLPWMSVSFDINDSNNVKIKFTEEAKPFLLQLTGYVKIQGKYICSLQSRYGTWLYPVLKMIHGKYYGEHIITIERLMQLTFTDDKKSNPSYHSIYGVSNFLKRVMGIQKNQQSKTFEIVKGSPINDINENTDIIVSVEVLKSGNKYDRIHFSVRLKSEMKKITSPANPLKYDTLKSDRFAFSMDLKEIYAIASELNISVDELCKKNGYVIKNGKAYKANPNYISDKKQNNLFSGGLDAYISE